MVEKEKDIIERLRKGRSANEWVSEELAHEAADEIERLRAKLKEAEEEYDLGEIARIAQGI